MDQVRKFPMSLSSYTDQSINMVAMDVDEVNKTVEEKPASKEEIANGKPSVNASLASIVAMLESAVKQRDVRLIASRLLRLTAVIRSSLTPSLLAQFLQSNLGQDAASSKAFLIEQLQVSRSHAL